MKDKFAQYFGPLPDGTSAKIPCPWHDDDDPSLLLNYGDGRYHCFGCGKHGHIDELLSSDFGKEIDLETVKMFHEKLMSKDLTLSRDYVRSAKGWTDKVLRDFMIGHNGTRLTIPVWADKIGGRCINIRMYHPSKAPKMHSYGKGYGANVWFPFPPTGPEIYLMEGESDTILARSKDLPAFCHTGGAGYWCNQFTQDLDGKKVNIVYDNDKAGQSGANAVINAIKFTSEVRNLRLPLSNGKDFSDWILREGGDLTQLAEVKASTAPYAVSRMQVTVDNPTDLPLFETANARWAYKAVTCQVVVAGKDRSPYMIPYKYVIECQPNNKRAACVGCPNHKNSGKNQYFIDWRDGKLTRFVDLPEMTRDLVLCELTGIPRGCRPSHILIEEYQNIEKLALFPRRDVLTMDVDMPAEVNMLRKAYFLGIGVQTNATYTVRGIPIPDTRDQSSVLLIIEADPVDTVEEVTDLTPCECFRLEEEDANVPEGKTTSGIL
jgi:hypothetical protein